VQEQVLETATRQALLDDVQIIDSSLQVGNATTADIRLLIRAIMITEKLK
jgi:hypothetical protein